MLKHPRFRVRDVLAMDAGARSELFEAIRAAVKLLPIRPADIELCGSYARGCARLHSDVDFNLAGGEGESRQWYIRQAMDSEQGRAFWKVLAPFTERTGLRVDASSLNWRSRENSTIYSLGEGRMFGRDDGQPIVCSQRWNKVEKKFDRKEPRHIRAEWDRDQWAAEVPEWRARYGAAFIECETRECDGRVVMVER